MAKNKKIEKKIYKEAVTDMRSMIEKELKEMQRLVGIGLGDDHLIGKAQSESTEDEQEKQDGQKSVSTRSSVESDRMSQCSLNNNTRPTHIDMDALSLQSSIDEDFIIDNDLILRMVNMSTKICNESEGNASDYNSIFC